MKYTSLDTAVKFQLSTMRYATCWCKPDTNTAPAASKRKHTASGLQATRNSIRY